MFWVEQINNELLTMHIVLVWYILAREMCKTSGFKLLLKRGLERVNTPGIVRSSIQKKTFEHQSVKECEGNTTRTINVCMYVNAKQFYQPYSIYVHMSYAYSKYTPS